MYNGKNFGFNDTYNAFSGAQTAAAIYTPGSTGKVMLRGYLISTTSANVVTLKIGSTVIATLDLAANGGANLISVDPIAWGTAGSALTVTSSATGNLYVSAVGTEAV